MDRDTHVEFLRNLSDDYLHKHMKMYVRNGMDEQAARADIEIQRRREERNAA